MEIDEEKQKEVKKDEEKIEGRGVKSFNDEKIERSKNEGGKRVRIYKSDKREKRDTVI
jgi:hypothetical protein